MASPSDADRAWELRGTDPSAARDAAERALAVHPADPRALAALGYARLRLGDVTGAEQAVVDALAGGRAAGDPVAVARALVGLGVLRRGQARYAEAVATFREAADVFRRLDDAGSVAGVSINLALVFKNLGDSARALELLLSAERGFRESGDVYGEAVALNNVVSVYRELGDEAAALPMARRLCGLSARLGSPVFEVNAQVALSAALAANGERPAAIEAAERAVALATPAGVPQILADALGGLGQLLAPVDPERAHALVTEAARVLGETADAWAVVSAQVALAEIQLARGAPHDARGLAERAADLATEHGELGLADRAWRLAARACEGSGDLGGAVRAWGRADEARAAAEADRRSRSLILVEVNAAIATARAEADRHRRRIAELAATGRFRSDLLGMVAHDLRSPLTAAMMSVDLLTERVTTRTDAQLTDDLGIALHRMKRIIDALCDDAADEYGAFALQLGDEDLVGLAVAIAREHEVFARAKQVRVVVIGAPTRARFDAGRLAHTIDNLVSNAVKYTPSGSVVEVRVSSRPGRVRLEVEDEGPGVAAGDVGRLFQPFGRGGATPTGGERSTGLGLYIARRMIDLHNGQIGVEPGPRGARFWFEIPA